MTAGLKPVVFRPVRIFLGCGHELWFRRPLPHLGDLLWCPKCDTPTERRKDTT